MLLIDVAILTQRIWHNVGFTLQGLFSGMAMMHIIYDQIYFKWLYETIKDNSLIIETYTSIFSFFIGLTIVSSYDKIGLFGLGLPHLKQNFKNQLQIKFLIFLLIVTFFLHQVIMVLENNLLSVNNNVNNKTTAHEDRSNWKLSILFRDCCIFLSWFLICLDTKSDMLLTYLRNSKQ